jgi:L-threonylcarbamoyladenylate synthase
MNEIKAAAQALIHGHLVAFATETVYGLGADASNQQAINRIYIVKDRPKNHPLIVHISNKELLSAWAVDIPDYAQQLAKDFWPGPMTLILKRGESAKDFLTGGQDSIGLRIPNHPIALALLKEFESLGGKGVAAPSANRFGKISPTTKAAVEQELKNYLNQDDLILDGGASQVGIESTIIDCTSDAPAILRPGAITSSMIEKSTKLKLKESNNKIRVSGSLDSHYAPNAKVILDQTPQKGDGLIALANYPTPEGVIRLAEPIDTDEYAKILYSALRLADERSLTRVIAITPKNSELAIAIYDRLSKASK